MEMLVWLKKAEQAVLKITFPNQMFSTKISNLTENDFLMEMLIWTKQRNIIKHKKFIVTYKNG